MNIQQIIGSSLLELKDAEHIVAHVLNCDRSFIKAHPEQTITNEAAASILQMFERLKKGELMAYIIECTEFYGRTFFVDSRVLIPRSCTEQLVQSAVQAVRKPNTLKSQTEIDTQIICWEWFWGTEPVKTIIEVGTGSGAVAISIALEEQNTSIIATDSSSKALEVAAKNRATYGLESQMSLRQEADFSSVKNELKPFIVVSNPPYIPTTQSVQPSVHDYEPHDALFAGKEGIDVLLAILAAAKANPLCQGVVFECQTEQPDLVLNQLDLRDD